MLIYKISPFLEGHIYLDLRQLLHANVRLISVINGVDSDAAAVYPGQPPDYCLTALTPDRAVFRAHLCPHL